MMTLKENLQEDATRTLSFGLMKLTHHTFKNKSSSRKRISVVAGLAIAKGNVVFTERNSYHGNTESKKEGQGQNWQYAFSTAKGEKVPWPMNRADQTPQQVCPCGGNGRI